MALRLAFASSTCIAPDILILDEMIGAGDAAFQEKAMERINKTLNDTKILVLASHDVGLLNLYCEKGIWLEKGRVMAQGPIAEVIKMYQDSLHSPL
jgi:ABC-2 type transport system ATP-binding protein/lipopolysaccharide transport system ATP-binding protein